MSREENNIVGSLVSLCQRVGVTCLVQVGAEDGYEADEIRKATSCRTVAIDADPQCEPCSLNIEWHRVLIGATDCQGMTFYVNKEVGLSTPFQRHSGHGEEVRHYNQERLDTFCKRVDIAPDALIIDTEGSTLDVLEGAGGVLGSVKMIYAEVQAHAIREGIRPVSAVDALLLPMGFTHHRALPSYDGGAQSNLTYLRG